MDIYAEQFDSCHDFGTDGSPTTQYIMATTPRCGSHLIAHTLYTTGVMGFPLEYFNNVNIPYWHGRFGTKTLCEMAEAIKRHRTSSNGCFGVKMHFTQFRQLARTGGFDRIFQNPTFILIRRRDLLAQALSLVKARQTESWISHQTAKRDPFFDPDSIDDAIDEIASHNAGWEAYLHKTGARLLHVEYEAFLQDSRSAVELMADFVGVRLSSSGVSEDIQLPVLQRTHLNEEWRNRYLDVTRRRRTYLNAKLLDGRTGRKERRSRQTVCGRARECMAHVVSWANNTARARVSKTGQAD